MEIQELFLKHYGKFENHRIPLKTGINIIYGGNETGKTTIHSFIRAMFFGLNRARGRAAHTDEYQVRQPWETPGAFLGSMRIQENGAVYRIDRCFDRSTKPLTVTREGVMPGYGMYEMEEESVEYAQPERVLGELLGQMSEAAFVNTVFVPQAKAETDEALAMELRRFMVNSDSTQDGQIDVTAALQGLRKKKKQFEQKKKKEDERMEEAIEKKQAQAELIRSEMELLQRQKGISAYDMRRPLQEREGQQPERATHLKWILEGLLLLAGILAFACAFFLTDWKIRVFLGVFGAVFLALIYPVHLLMGAQVDEEEEPEPDWGDERGRYLQEEIQGREEQYQRLQDELEELYHSHVRLDGTDTEIAALTMAIDRICELSSGIYAKSGGLLNRRASEILRELTGGAYDRIVLDETAEIRIHTPQRVLGLHQVSGGTLQQIYFALRMASGELLSEGRVLPIVLDETFAMYDDVRLEAALRWLKKSGRQVILFTCQKREREILERIS